jgi:hypothetical protein
MSFALIAPAQCFCGAPLRSTAELLLADEGEGGAEPLVFDNRPVVDLLDLVEGAVGQLNAPVTDRQPPIGVADHGDPLDDRRLGLVRRFQATLAEGNALLPEFIAEYIGSEHWWFEDRGPQCTLLVFVDDATRRLMHLQFVESESTFAYFHAARAYLEAWGKPIAFYSDKHGVFPG